MGTGLAAGGAMRSLWMTTVLATLVASPLARGEEMDNVLERPLLLPALSVQGELSGGVGVLPPANQGFPYGTSAPVFTEQAVSMGLPWHLQAGFDVREVFFGSESVLSDALLDVQRSIKPWLAARVDFGVSNSANAPSMGFTFGFGLPLKMVFDEHFALVSGASDGRAFGSSSSDVTFLPSNDLIALRTVDLPCFQTQSPPRFPGAGIGGSCDASGLWGTVGLPVGLLFQPMPGLSFGFRSGVRATVSTGLAPPSTSVPFYIPVAVDAVVSTWGKHMDIGLTGQVAATPTSLSNGATLALWSAIRM